MKENGSDKNDDMLYYRMSTTTHIPNKYPILPRWKRILKLFMIFYNKLLTEINYQKSWKIFLTHFV
jgi:hypothetical protein